MGRFSIKSNCQSTYRTSLLRKTADGGVSKQLTAAEKRKRMIEAGMKYATQNRKIKAECSGAHFMKFSVKMKPGSTNRTESCRKSSAIMKLQRISPRRNEQSADTHSSQISNSETVFDNHPDIKYNPKSQFVKPHLKPVNEIFERDDAALTSILNRCPQNSVCGRTSIFRGRERPSLFPNGINPLDTAAEKFARPMPLQTLTTRSFSLEPMNSANVVTTSILVTPSSAVKMSKRTPAKTVRFEKSVSFRSPEFDDMPPPETSVLKIDKPSLETTNEVILDQKMKFDDMLEKLRNLPEHVFSDLEKAVHQIAFEKLKNPNSRSCSEHPSNNTSLNSSTVSFTESEMKEVLPSSCPSSRDCIASRTRRKVRVSQVHINQKLPLTTEATQGRNCHSPLGNLP